METMGDSAGSADREMSKIEEGWDYKLNKLGETWVGVLQKMVDRKGFGSVMDMLQDISGAVAGLTDTFGGLSTAVGGFLGVLAIKGSSPLLNYNMKSGQKGGFLWPGNIKESLANRKELSSYKGLTEQDVVMLQNYNKAIDSGAPKFQAFKQNMDGCSKTAKTLAVDMAAGRKSMDQISAGFEQVNKTSKLAAFGMKALSIAGNMVLGMAIGAGISFVVGLIDDFIHRVDHAKEALEQFNSEAAEGRKKLDDQGKWIEENGAEYEKLAKGVDAYGNNVSLTSAEFDKYRNITKQIADMFPDMVAGWNAQGDAILKYSGSVDALNESLEKNKEKENARIRGTADEVFENYETVAKDTIRDGLAAYEAFSSGKIFGDNFEDAIIIEDGEIKGISQRDLFEGQVQRIGQTIFGDNQSMISQFQEETEDLINNGIMPTIERYSDAIKQAAKDAVNANEDAISEELDAMHTLMQAMAEAPDTGFKDLTDEQQAGISTFINTIDDSFIKQFDGNAANLKAWLKDNLVGNDSITSVFQDAYSASKDDFDSFSHYIEYIEQLLDKLRSLKGADGTSLVSESVIESIKQTLGVSDQSLTGDAGGRQLINDVKKAYKKIPGVDKFIDTLSEDNVRKLYEQKDVLGDARNYNEFLLKYKTELGKTSDNMEEIIDAAKEYRKNTKKASKYYKDTMSDALQFDINPRKTKYGNIDTNKRDVINNKDSISTVLGTWGSFNLKSGELIDAAWSPIIQAIDSDNGQTKKITDDMAMKYVQSLIESLENQGKVVDKENILKLDSEGTVIDGTKIKNIIADIGATAEDTAAKMHFVGELGEFNLASEDGWSMTDDYEIRKNLREKLSRTTSSILGDNWSNSQETGFANQANDTIESIKKIDDALTKLANGSFTDGDYYTLLKEFPDITKDTDNLESALKTLKSESSNNQLTAINDALDDYKLYIDAATEGTIDFEQEDLDNAVVAYQRLQDLRDGFLETSGAIIDAKDNFQEWQNATSTTNAGSTYDTMVGGLKQFKEDLAKGLIGTDDSITFAKMFTPEGSEVDFQKSLDKAKRYLTEDFKGLQHFLDDAVKNGVAKKGKGGIYDIFYQDLDKAAKKMKLPVSTMKSMMLKLRDYGFNVNVYKDSADALDQYISKTAEIAKLESEKASGIGWTKDKQKELKNLKQDAEEARKAYEKLLKVDANEIAERAEKGTKAADALWKEMEKVDKGTGAYKGLNTQAKKDAAKNQIVQFYKELKQQYGTEHENFEQYINGLDVVPDNSDTKQTPTSTSWEVADQNRKELNEQADELEKLKKNSVEAKESLTNVNNLLPKIDENAKKPTMENMNRSLVTTQQRLNNIKSTLGTINNTTINTTTTTTTTTKPKKGTIRYNGSQKEKWDGKTWIPFVNGTVEGLGFAKGNALIGELGPELLVRDDKWHLMGRFGAEMFDYKEGDIIFNHKQTEDLLKSGSIRGRGTAFLNGSAFRGGVSGEGQHRKYGTTETKKTKKTKKTKDKKNSTKKEKQEIDWIERRITRINNLIGQVQAKVENIGKWVFGKNNLSSYLGKDADNLKKTNDELQKEYNYYKKLYKMQGEAQREYKKKANTYAKKLPKGVKNKIESGNYTDKDLKYWFSKYGQKTYDNIEKYKDYFDKSEAAKQAKEEALKAAREILVQKRQNHVDLDEKLISQYEAQEDIIVGYKNKNKLVKEQLKTLKDSYKYQLEIAQLNGEDAEYQRLKAEYEQKRLELLYHELENIKEQYEISRGLNERRIKDVENELSVAQAQGRRVNTGWYTSLNINERSLYELANAEAEALKKQFEEAGFKKGSKEWNDALNDIQDAEDKAAEALKNISSNLDSIREAIDSAYDEMRENNNLLYEEAQFLASLNRGENINTADKYNGYYMITKAGLGNMSTASIGIDVAKKNQQKDLEQYAETQKLINEIKSKGMTADQATAWLQSDKSGLYDSYEKLIEADKKYRKQFIDDRKAQMNAENELINLMKEYYEGQKSYLAELIEARKKLLQEEKDLYDYQKNITEKTKNISTLQKRLSALQGDNSEAGKARRQQIQNQLDQAQQDLQDTEYDRWKSDQEAMLDNLANQFNDIVDRHLKDPEAVLEEGVGYVKDNSSLLNGEFNEVNNQLSGGFNDVINALTGSNSVGTILDKINSNIEQWISEQEESRKNAKGKTDKDDPDATEKGDSINEGTGGSNSNNKNKNTSSPVIPFNRNSGKYDSITRTNEIARLEKLGKDKTKTAGTKKEITRLRAEAMNNIGKYGTQEECDLVNWLMVNSTGKTMHPGSDLNKVLLGGYGYVLGSADLSKLAVAYGFEDDKDWTSNGAAYKFFKSLGYYGFKTGGIGRLVKASGEDGFAMVRNGEGFIAPEHVNAVQEWMNIAPDMAQMMSMVSKATGDGGTTTIGEMNFELPNVTDPRSFIETFQNSKEMQRLFKVSVEDLTKNGRLTNNIYSV